MMKLVALIFLSIFFTVSCAPRNRTQVHDIEHKSKLKEVIKNEEPISSLSPYFLVILVDAKNYNYRDAGAFLDSFCSVTSDRNFGHAWFVLQGIHAGKKVLVEGGHSGELGFRCPRYLDTIIEKAENNERDPIRYLHQPLEDGYFELGSGNHSPTFAIRIDIDEEAFLKMYNLVKGKGYLFSRYNLTDSQCTTFVVKLASIGGLTLDHEVEIPVPQKVFFRGRMLTLWHDERYSKLVVGTPEKLEKSMLEACQKGNAKPALRWYRTYQVRYECPTQIGQVLE